MIGGAKNKKVDGKSTQARNLLYTELVAGDRPYPLEEKHPVITPGEEIRSEGNNNEPTIPGITPTSYDDMPSEREVEETFKHLQEESDLSKFGKWLVTDPAKAQKETPPATIHNDPTILSEMGSEVTNVVPEPSDVVIPASDKKEEQASEPLIQLSTSAEQSTEPMSTSSVPSITDSPKSKKGCISSFVNGQLNSFGTSIVEQEKKKKADAEKKAAQRKNLVNWFLGKKPVVQENSCVATVSAPEKVIAGEQVASKQKNGNRKGLFDRISGNKKKEIDDLPEFKLEALSQPNLDGPLTQTDVTYAVYPPFIFVRIKFDGEEIVYYVLEPPLGEGQKKRLETIEKNLEKLISSKIVMIKPEEREQFLRQKFDDIIRMYNWNLTEAYKDRMFFYLRKKYLGYDRIEVLMKDHFIEDVSCNGPNNYLYIFHRIYGSIRTTISYEDVELNRFVMRMAQISGRHISILQPIKDIALPDGSRANLTLGTEVTKKGATFTIRKFKERPISPIELIEYNSVDPYLLAFLWTLLYYKRSILVSGGTASGKTTLMNVLCAFIKPENKIVSLEDTPELNLYHPNWIQSVTRSGFGGESGGAAPASGTSHQGGKSAGDISMYDLLAAALRQRPEYILVGEVRGAEAFTLFQAIAVGHAAMGTIHAGSMRELLSRVESNPMNVPRTLFASMDCVVFPAQVRRNDRNVRRVMQAVEILELDTDGDLVTNLAFRWDAFTDKFSFSGRSHIFEKIEAQLGIKQEELIKDMSERAAFLKDLQDRGIKDYYEVVDHIREYELNKISSRQSKK